MALIPFSKFSQGQRTATATKPAPQALREITPKLRNLPATSVQQVRERQQSTPPNAAQFGQIRKPGVPIAGPPAPEQQPGTMRNGRVQLYPFISFVQDGKVITPGVTELDRNPQRRKELKRIASGADKQDYIDKNLGFTTKLLTKSADKVSEFFAPIAERGRAIVQSVKTKSFAPLKQSLEQQFDEIGYKLPSRNLTKQEYENFKQVIYGKAQPFNERVAEAVRNYNAVKNTALIANVDAGMGFGEKGKASVSKSTATPKNEIAAPKVEQSPKRTQGLGKKSQEVSSYVPSIGQKEIPYNVDRLNISSKAKTAVREEIENARKQAEKVIGGKLTHRETIALADETSQTLTRVVTREQTEKRVAQTLKLRQQIAAAAEGGKVDEQFVDMWLKDKANAADIARQLQARRIAADPKEASVIDTLLNGIYKEIGYSDEIAKAAKGVDFNDAKQATEFYRKFVKPKASEWLDLVRYNSMLSSPNTHINNIASNFEGSGIIAPIEKTITGLLDATRAALTGGERQYYAKEGIEYAKGYVSSLTKAKDNFVALMRGQTFNKNPDIKNIPLATKGFGKYAEKVLNPPLKMLEGMDQFFTALAQGGEKAALEYRASKGVKVGNVDALASEAAAKRLFRSDLNLKEQGPVLNAIDSVTGIIEMARHSDNPIVSTIAKSTIPFVRTPMNIFKQGIEYSPFGISTLYGATNKTEQVSKIVIGMASAVGAATLLGSDRLTWAEPTDAKAKAQFKAAGRQAYSVKIGDKWVSYSKLHPALAFNFALVASIDDSIKSQKLTDDEGTLILTTFAKWANFLADQSYMKNIGDFVAGAKGDVEGFAKQLSNYPAQVIPYRALASWVERLIDPVQRKPDPDGSLLNRQMQYVISQIPGLAQTVPPRLDNEGQPIPNQNRIWNSVSPNRITTENPEGEKGYNKSIDIKKFKQEQQVKTDERTARAQELLDRLAAEDPRDAKQDFEAIRKVDPEMAKKITDLKENKDLGLSYEETQIKSLGVEDGTRAKYLAQEFSSIATKEEKAARWNDYIKKKIITKEVADQLSKLLKQANN